MLFSVIIPAYKMGRYICEALESVAAQTYKNWEVIVVDDCAPDDGSAEIVRVFATKYNDHRVDLIRHEVNKGVSWARNTAINASQGVYLAFLDPDDFWLPNYLDSVWKHLLKNPKIDVTSSPPIAVWEASDTHKEYQDIIRFEYWQTMQFPASLALGNFLQPSSTVVRKSCVEEIGGFDTDRAMQHIEDYDLWIRLAQAGVMFSFIEQNLTKYRKHPTAATSDTLQMDKLHERLACKHTAFFINAQRQMLWVIMRDVRAIRRSVKNPVRTIISKIFRR